MQAMRAFPNQARSRLVDEAAGAVDAAGIKSVLGVAEGEVGPVEEGVLVGVASRDTEAAHVQYIATVELFNVNSRALHTE